MKHQNMQSKRVPVSVKTLQKLELLSFNFEVVGVNAKGEQIKKESKQSQYFSEDLGNGITLEYRNSTRLKSIHPHKSRNPSFNCFSLTYIKPPSAIAKGRGFRPIFSMNLINYLLEKFSKVQFRTLLVAIGLLLAYSLAVIIGRLVYAAGVMGIGDFLCVLGLYHAWQAIADLVRSVTQLLVSPPTNPPTSINLETEELGDK
uniref:Uncharacterized protein n=1 Tax=Bacteriophage sp. TaxID=38018 RepID=A0A7G9A424_9VIRU|nr:MAG: hypothetical protein [Bacteriophage sp.]